MSNIHTTPLLELIELLEKQGFFDKPLLTRIITPIKSLSLSPEQKVTEFAKRIDALVQNSLSESLAIANKRLAGIERLILTAYFILGFCVVAGLLATQVVNFFYIFVILLGWHTISLLLWLFSSNSKKISHFYPLLDKFSPNNPPSKQAFMVALSHYNFNILIHKTALNSLLGSFLALVGLFLVKSYQFNWQSTLLSNAILQKIINAIGFIPSLFGITIPNLSNSDNLAFNFAVLTLSSITIYGIIPRLLALFWSIYHKPNITQNSDYITRLLSEFSQTIVDKDDFKPSIIKPMINTNFTATTLFASLEIGNKNIDMDLDIGIIDNKEDLQRLQNAINTHQLTLCLTINSNLVADRGIIRKLDEIMTICRFGLKIQLIEGTHLTAWQEILTTKGIFWEV